MVLSDSSSPKYPIRMSSKSVSVRFAPLGSTLYWSLDSFQLSYVSPVKRAVETVALTSEMNTELRER